MSGHSKWATIKRQKGVADQKRGQAFTKLANAITIAVKTGGGIGDPAQNIRLRLLVEKARFANMPKSNIERAIERGTGAGEGVGSLEEAVYEGFSPHGAAVIVEAATDNKQRTIGDIKNIFDKEGGTLGQPGSVSYQFEQKGMIVLEKSVEISADEVMLLAADAGAEDIEEIEDGVVVYTKLEDLAKVREALSSKGQIIKDAELTRKPMVIKSVENEEEAKKIISFLEKLEGLDDVQKVYTNASI